MENFRGIIEKVRERIFSKNPDFSIISKVLSDELSTPLSEKNISIKNRVLFVKTSNIIKGEILLRKKVILEKLQEVTPKGVITDIR